MKSYRRMNGLIALIVTLYVLVGYGTQFFGFAEVFPFYSWDLFSKIPQAERSDFGLQFTSIDKSTLSQPLYFEDSGQWLSHADSIEAYVLIQNLGNALAFSDLEKIKRIRQQLENIYMSEVENTGYRIVRRRFNIRQRWLDHHFLSEDSLASFTTGNY